jgi:hypothetical protein
MRKAQFEIFGVVLIVIIIVLAMFFMIGTTLKKPKDITQSYVDAELGQNMLNSMLKMNLEDCGGKTFTDIINDCKNGIDNSCSSHANTCLYVKELSYDVLENTLGKWNKKYRFRILKTAGASENDILKDIAMGSVETVTNDDDCDDFALKETPGVQPLPGASPVKVQLDICK